ncbi:hypothetical protein [Salmonella bongori]|uniref:hypothetical protein n=1 Tax=Salmonella bongori TaxID=54736 RepID=UPI0015C4E1D8|nr:hypothetical protein [Salmonella bongori]
MTDAVGAEDEGALDMLCRRAFHGYGVRVAINSAASFFAVACMNSATIVALTSST